MKISFAHNVQNRFRTLRETIEMERKFFPDAPIYVAYNDDTFNLRYFVDIKNIKFIRYVGKGHKIGCVNGCITSIKNSLVDDSDVIVFSHDDVKINPAYIEIFRRKINEIMNDDVDIICRRPDSYGDNYYMMEGFYINKKTAKLLFENQKLYNKDGELPKDIKKSPSPEVWLHNVLKKDELNIDDIKYKHVLNNYNKILGENLGFYHKNAGKRGWSD